jgi:hypothetical protein
MTTPELARWPIPGQVLHTRDHHALASTRHVATRHCLHKAATL